MKFADGTKLSRKVDVWEKSVTLQEDLDGLEEWNLRKFNKDRSKVLHLGEDKPGTQHRLGSAYVERDLRILVDNKLNVSDQCTDAAQNQWDAGSQGPKVTKDITSRDEESLSHSAALATPRILCSGLGPAV